VRLEGRGEQVVGALDAQPVGAGEGPVEVAYVVAADELGRLVDDHVRPDGRHGGAHRAAVEDVEDDGRGAGLAQGAGAPLRARGADDLVAALDEPGADGARGAGDEHTHLVPPGMSAPADEMRPPAVTCHARRCYSVSGWTWTTRPTCAPT